MNNGSKHRAWIAVLLAVALGSFGAHRSYMGNYRKCLLYAMFAWTGVPFVLGVIEAFYMPRRVEIANQEGRSVGWMGFILFPVLGFVLMYPTAVIVLFLIISPLTYWFGEDAVAYERPIDRVIHQMEEVIEGPSSFRVFEGKEVEVALKVKELLEMGEGAYVEQALPFLLEILPPGEFSTRYLSLFRTEELKLTVAGSRSIPQRHDLRVQLQYAEITQDDDAVRELSPKIEVVNEFMERVEGPEIRVGFKARGWELGQYLNFTYIYYDGEYRLARVFFSDDPLEWEDIYEYLRQTGGTEGQAEVLKADGDAR